ncbi:MAG: hypothetical protein AVDCRST_MAG57-1089 [uncultured Blastococcus sp.]|uniref:Uncharacterized protein n=1 Tax=uncultured Blastococcus sp. TaxID=217144 RepID=A0A6J4HTW1_9ACTN|nr:MAG: hypothetical protein AVDCRST_MAG57-1089 [uncultured Blastococcus sp.]
MSDDDSRSAQPLVLLRCSVGVARVPEVGRPAVQPGLELRSTGGVPAGLEQHDRDHGDDQDGDDHGRDGLPAEQRRNGHGARGRRGRRLRHGSRVRPPGVAGALRGEPITPLSEAGSTPPAIDSSPTRH